MRQVWRRLAHKQWLILYPLALSVVNILAFLAVYSAAGGVLRWSKFFATDFDRWGYVRDHFISGFSFTPALAVAVFVGLAACLFAAMLRAPFFRAIAGPGYPLAPRSWEETGRLTLYYVVANLVFAVLPSALPKSAGLGSAAALAVASFIKVIVVFADYVIVFEGLAFIPALRRSARLVSRRWAPVLLGFIVAWILWKGVALAYGRYYQNAEGASLLVPLSQVLIMSIISLVLDIYFIFLYEYVRNTGSNR
jgi:hypothetical protein